MFSLVKETQSQKQQVSLVRKVLVGVFLSTPQHHQLGSPGIVTDLKNKFRKGKKEKERVGGKMEQLTFTYHLLRGSCKRMARNHPKASMETAGMAWVVLDLNLYRSALEEASWNLGLGRNAVMGSWQLPCLFCCVLSPEHNLSP